MRTRAKKSSSESDRSTAVFQVSSGVTASTPTFLGVCVVGVSIADPPGSQRAAPHRYERAPEAGEMVDDLTLGGWGKPR